jgi:hypothetical protein
LDSANCNKKRREKFLENISCEHCVVQTNKRCISAHGLNWIAERKLKCYQLIVTDENSEVLPITLDTSKIIHLEIDFLKKKHNHIEASSITVLFLKRCPNVKNLFLKGEQSSLALFFYSLPLSILQQFKRIEIWGSGHFNLTKPTEHNFRKFKTTVNFEPGAQKRYLRQTIFYKDDSNFEPNQEGHQ